MKVNDESEEGTISRPKTVEDAELFLRCLGEMVTAGTLSRFASRHVTDGKGRDVSVG
jgi:hypothetical protein